MGLTKKGVLNSTGILVITRNIILLRESRRGLHTKFGFLLFI